MKDAISVGYHLKPPYLTHYYQKFFLNVIKKLFVIFEWIKMFMHNLELAMYVLKLTSVTTTS